MSKQSTMKTEIEYNIYCKEILQSTMKTKSQPITTINYMEILNTYFVEGNLNYIEKKVNELKEFTCSILCNKKLQNVNVICKSSKTSLLVKSKDMSKLTTDFLKEFTIEFLKGGCTYICILQKIFGFSITITNELFIKLIISITKFWWGEDVEKISNLNIKRVMTGIVGYTFIDNETSGYDFEAFKNYCSHACVSIQLGNDPECPVLRFFTQDKKNAEKELENWIDAPDVKVKIERVEPRPPKLVKNSKGLPKDNKAECKKWDALHAKTHEHNGRPKK